MPIIVHTQPGKVTGIWGSALIRTSDGSLHPLKIGDHVNQGDLLLTSQDGIVEITRAGELTRIVAPEPPISELIAELSQVDPRAPPSAGIDADVESGLGTAERVMRISEAIDSRPIAVAVISSSVTLRDERRVPSEMLRPAIPRNDVVVAVEEGPAVSLRVSPPVTTNAVAALTVDQVPIIGEVRTANGTVLAVGTPLTSAQLAGLVYVPPAEYDGRSRVGEFVYTLDDAVARVTRSVEIVVVAVNDAPTAMSAHGSGDEDHAAPLLLQGEDVDGRVTSFVLHDVPSHGRLLLAGSTTALVAGQTISAAQAATLRFEPDPDFNGDVQLLYSAVDDGGRSSAPARHTQTVTPMNDAPQARADGISALEDAAVTIGALGNDLDVDGDALHVASVQGLPIGLQSPVRLPNGTVSLNPDGTLMLTPSPDFNGTVAFVYAVTDGALSSNSAQVTVAVAPVNDAPVARPDRVATPINAAVNVEVLGNDTDVDGDTLVVASAGLADPSQGVVEVSADGTLRFTPALDLGGPVVVDYTLRDPGGLTATSSAIVDVGDNTPPVGANGRVDMTEDTSHRFSASDFTFLDPDALQSFAAIRIDAVADAGTLTFRGGRVTAGQVVAVNDLPDLMFAPAANANGPGYASLTLRVQDSAGAFAVAPSVLSINVTAVNDPPVAAADALPALEDTPLMIPAAQLLGNDTDADSDALSISSVSSVTGGSVALGSDGEVTFTPFSNFNGTASFTYAVSDGSALSNRAVVAVDVAPVNDAPVSQPDVLGGTEDTRVTFSAAQLLANDDDVDGDALSVVSVASRIGGTADLNADGTVSFTPTPNFHGAARFDYVASDGSASGAITAVTVNVAPVNDEPVARPDSLAGVEDTPITFSAAQLLGNDSDPDGDALNIASIVSGSGGSAVLNDDGSVTFRPAANFNGLAAFTYAASDDRGASTSAGVSVAVASVNDVPIGRPDALSAIEDSTVTFSATQLLGNDFDVDGDALSIASVTSGTGGSAVLNADRTVSFTPTPDFSGAATFNYVASDGATSSAVTVVSVGVLPVNDAPVARPDTLSIVEDTVTTFSAAQLLGNDTDADADTLTIASVASGSGGTAALNADGSVTFTPGANFNGVADFSYTASDGANFSPRVGVSVDIAAVNDAPLAVPDTATTVRNQTLVLAPSLLLDNDVEVDIGDALRIASVQDPSGGTVTLDALGNVVFVPGPGQVGPAAFTYTVTDAVGASSSAAVNVTIVASPEPTNPPMLVAPGRVFGLAPGPTSASAATGIVQSDLEQLLGLGAGALDRLDPPPGAASHNGFVDVVDGGLTTRSLSVAANGVVAFDWSFFNEELVPSEIPRGWNDMLLLAITDPVGERQIIQLASSEQTGVNVNGAAVDAAGTYAFTAALAGEHSFSWLVTNGRDVTKDSSMAVAAPRFIVNGASFGAPVPFDVSAQSTDPGSAASLRVTVSGVPEDAAFSAGTDNGAGRWTFTPDELIGLNFLPAAGFVGTLTLSVVASTVDALGSIVPSLPQQTVVTIDATTLDTTGTLAPDILTGTSANDHLQGFAGDDRLDGGDGSDLLYGDAGDDVLSAGNGNDWLHGGAGRDALTGDAGSDRLFGGAGDDSLTGGANGDVFAWTLADRGSLGNPATDVIVDFEVAFAVNGGDVLDLRDLLVGEAKSGLAAGNLDQYLDFDTTSTAGSTVVRLSSAGAFIDGAYAPGAEDQRIVLQGVDLRNGAVLGLGVDAGDGDIIRQMLQRGTLIADGP